MATARTKALSAHVTGSSRFDLFASMIAFMVAGTIGGMIWNDISLFDQGQDVLAGDGIAIVSDMKHIVRRKTGGLPVWKPASQQETLHSGDYVFTDRGSAMKLTFVDRTQVELGENTMIQIERTQNQPTLQLMQGTMRADTRKGNKPLLIKLGKKGTLLKTTPDAEVQIQTSPNGQASVAVLSGNAAIVEGSQTVAVDASQAVIMNDSGEIGTPQTIPLRLLAPRHEESVFIQSQGNIEFSWRLEEDVDVMFELARDPQFKQVVFREDVTDDLLQVERPEAGVHYWRIVPRGVDASMVEIRTLTVVVNEPPTLLWPADQAVLEKKSEQNPTYRLVWQGNNKDSYEIEISRTEDFSSSVVKFSSAWPSLQTPPLAETKYYWRVRKSGDHATEWSAISQFSVQGMRLPTAEEATEELLPPPDLDDAYEIETPGEKDGASLWERFLGIGVAYAADGDVQTIQWPAVKNAQGYFVQIAQEEAFKQVVKEAEVYVAQFSFEGFKPGTYFLRIATLDKKKSKGAFSKPVRVTISYPAPRLVKPADKAKILVGEGTEFDWRKVDGAKSYRVEFAHDAAFKKIVKTETPPLSSVMVKQNELGTYYWRVIALFPPQGVSKPSAVRIITVEKAPEVVAQTPPPAPVPPPPEMTVAVPPAPLVTVEQQQPEALSRQKTVSLTFGISPSFLKYKMMDSKANADIDATLFNAYFMQIRAPLGRRLEMHLSGQRAATELFRDQEQNGQKKQPISLLQGQWMVAYALTETSSLQDRWMGIRAGLGQHSVLQFKRRTLRTTDVNVLSLLGPSLGGVFYLPISQNYVTTLSLDYAHLQNAKVKSAVYLTTDLNMQQNLAKKFFLHYGLRHTSGRSTFREKKDGASKDHTSSVTMGLGYHF